MNDGAERSPHSTLGVRGSTFKYVIPKSQFQNVSPIHDIGIFDSMVKRKLSGSEIPVFDRERIGNFNHSGFSTRGGGLRSKLISITADPLHSTDRRYFFNSIARIPPANGFGPIRRSTSVLSSHMFPIPGAFPNLPVRSPVVNSLF
jgi:hypothetical protein